MPLVTWLWARYLIPEPWFPHLENGGKHLPYGFMVGSELVRHGLGQCSRAKAVCPVHADFYPTFRGQSVTPSLVRIAQIVSDVTKYVLYVGAGNCPCFRATTVDDTYFHCQAAQP
jgi:hypothetical protein